MDCAHCREAISARLDGEADPADEALIDAHLEACAGCLRFVDDAARVTRLARTTVATEVPDLVGAVLAAAPRARLPRLITALRILLAVVGVAQLAVALGGVLAVWTDRHEHPAAQLDGASLQHFAHESAAWNLALGVGFVWVAWRSSRTSGVVPTLATFVVVLTALVALDVTAGRVDPSRLLMHGLVLLGLVLVILLDRRRPAGGSVPGGARSPRRGSSLAPAADSAIDPGPDGLPRLRPTAQHRGTAVAIQRDGPDTPQRRTA
ncbi:MAG: zf-HC2 domain-containing protein [Pseudonocardiaceae bacterium]